MRYGWLIALAAIFTQDAQAIQLGHNLSPTSYTLRKNEVSLGNYFAGIGITDNLLVGTSPWMIVNYNMPTIGMRYSFQGDELLQRFAFDFYYFKTLPYGLFHYVQESFFARVVGTHRFGSGYAVHLSGGYQHFYDAESPYSLHRAYYSSDPTVLSAGALHEINLSEQNGIFLETAILGLNYLVPYAHLGVSAFHKARWGMVQLGLSYSMILADEAGWYRREEGGTWIWQSESSFHPEIQVQFSL